MNAQKTQTKGKKKRLFVIVNPTQYMNAVEYVYQHGSHDDHMVIITPFSAGIEELNKLGASELFEDIRHLDTLPYFKSNDKVCWKARWKFLYAAYEDIKPDELIVGNLIDNPTYPFVLREQKKFTSITVLDDGTPTLGVAMKRERGGFYFAYHFLSIRLLVKTLLYLKTFPPIHLPPAVLAFFTIFNVPLGTKDELVVNDFGWLKTKIEPKETTNEALFVGSNLVDRGLVRENVYLRSLETVREEVVADGYEMVYCHHRGESEKMRKAIGEICRTVDFDIPLELALLNRPRPALVSGHFTSALFTLSRIYSDIDVRAYLFPKNDLMGSVYESNEYLLLVQETLSNDPQIETRNL